MLQLATAAAAAYLPQLEHHRLDIWYFSLLAKLQVTMVPEPAHSWFRGLCLPPSIDPPRLFEQGQNHCLELERLGFSMGSNGR